MGLNGSSDAAEKLENHVNGLSYESLLNELTLEEKVSLLSGKDFRSTPGVPRLGIPPLKLLDSINGVSSELHGAETTACFPSSTCLASTWNAELLEELGEQIGYQAKLKSTQIILGPTINIHRDPRSGRNFECFSEDPLLSGQLGAAVVRGIQSKGVGACAKHFVCNDSETSRRKYNVDESINSRHVREIYAGAFQHLLKNSNPVGLMTAYNKVDGTYCSENPMIENLIRKEWNYSGCMISDWFGTNSGIPALEAGLDLEMPGPSVFRGKSLIEAVEAGKIGIDLIDARVSRVLQLRDRTKPSHSTSPEQFEVSEVTNTLARNLASEGIVLLKNDRNALPLNLEPSTKIAVIGEAAETPVITGGGSASATPQYIQKPVEHLRQAHPNPTQVQYARGVRTRVNIPMVPSELIKAKNGEHGVDIVYFNGGSEEPVLTEFSEIAKVNMLGRFKPQLDSFNFRSEMSTTLTPESTGLHTLAVRVSGAFALYVDGVEVLSGSAPNINTEQFLFCPFLLERKVNVDMTAQKPYEVRLVTHSREAAINEPTPYGSTICFEEYYSDREAIAEAVKIASESDVSIIYAGRNGEYESEGFDLTSIELPESQNRLIRAVSSVSARTVVVLNCGNPIDVSPFVDNVDAILNIHFPGQEGTQALVDILTGKVSPSGKLATTWFKTLEDCPTYNYFPAKNRASGPEIRYTEELGVGYRCPDLISKARWPFGYGLSYTSFSYSDFSITVAEPSAKGANSTERVLQCSVTIQNTGAHAGKEVAQLFVSPPSSSTIWRPERELKSFAKVFLQPGESKRVCLPVETTVAFGHWDESLLLWKVEKGLYTLDIGGSRTNFQVQEETTKAGL